MQRLRSRTSYTEGMAGTGFDWCQCGKAQWIRGRVTVGRNRDGKRPGRAGSCSWFGGGRGEGNGSGEEMREGRKEVGSEGRK